MIEKIDMEQMLNGKSLEKWKHSRFVSVIYHVVLQSSLFLIRHMSIHYLGEALTIIFLQRNLLYFQKNRKMSCKSMMTRYHQKMNEDQNNNLKLSRTSYYKILQHIAHSGKIIISSVDYVSALQ